MNNRMDDLLEKLNDDDFEAAHSSKNGGKKRKEKRKKHSHSQESFEKESSGGVSEEFEQQENPRFEELIKKIHSCNEEIQIIEENCEKMLDLDEKNKKTVSEEKEKAIKEKIEDYIEKTNGSVQLVGEFINFLNKEIKESPIQAYNEQELKMLGKNSLALSESYKDAVQRFRDCQMGCKESMKNKVKRQIRILEPEKSSREVEKLVSDPSALKTVMEQKLMGKTHMRVRNAVKDISDKYNDIIVLENNIDQILSLLKEITLLVKESGSIVDEIELKLKAANEVTKKGLQNLKDAKEQHQSAQKKQWWMCLCAFMALVIVGSPTLLTILSNSKVI